MINAFWIIAGLALIIFGADFLTDGASALAKRFRISSMAIGLTVVAFGTSAPELSVSVLSAIEGSAGLSIGNVVGSNIFNILMIVGVTAIAAPIVITRATLTKEIPLAVLSSVVVLICANDVLLGAGEENVIDRADGLLMLCFFAIFMGYTFAIARDGDAAAHAAIKPLPMGGITNFDLLWLLGASVLMFVAGRYYKVRMITRSEGAMMVVAYLVYTGLLIAAL